MDRNFSLKNIYIYTYTLILRIKFIEPLLLKNSDKLRSEIRITGIERDYIKKILLGRRRREEFWIFMNERMDGWMKTFDQEERNDHDTEWRKIFLDWSKSRDADKFARALYPRRNSVLEKRRPPRLTRVLPIVRLVTTDSRNRSASVNPRDTCSLSLPSPTLRK